VGDLVPGILADLGLAEAARAARIAELWSEIVDGPEAGHSRPVGLRDGVLEVEVASSVWAQQIQLRREPILEALRERLGAQAPRGLRLRVGRDA